MSSKKHLNVLFLDEVHPLLEEKLTQINCICHHDYTSNKSEITEKAKHYDGIIIRSRIPMDADFLNANPQLQFIGRSGSGMENIDLKTANKHQIQCFSAPEANKNAVAEHALAMLLSLFNHINHGDLDIRNGNWRREFHRGQEISRKTIGLIGYGNNGSAFAQKLRSFGCTILAYDKYKTGFSNDFVTEVELEELQKQSDVISLHIPQNKETINMVNTPFIETCSKPFFLINTSRGKLVNTEALVDALKTSKIQGACLDVLEYEKASFSTLFEENNCPEAFEYLLKSKEVILSPHVAGWTTESYIRLSQVLAKKIINYVTQK